MVVRPVLKELEPKMLTYGSTKCQNVPESTLKLSIFWVMFHLIIVFWLYLAKETSYDVLNIVFEKSIFRDQIHIFNGEIDKNTKNDVRSESQERRNRFIELNDDFLGFRKTLKRFPEILSLNMVQNHTCHSISMEKKRQFIVHF